MSLFFRYFGCKSNYKWFKQFLFFSLVDQNFKSDEGIACDKINEKLIGTTPSNSDHTVLPALTCKCYKFAVFGLFYIRRPGLLLVK